MTSEKPLSEKAHSEGGETWFFIEEVASAVERLKTARLCKCGQGVSHEIIDEIFGSFDADTGGNLNE